MSKRSSTKEEYARITNMAEAVKLQTEVHMEPEESIERATAIWRRISWISRRTKDDPLVVFDKLPQPTQVTISHLFDACKLDDPELTGHLPERMKDNMENFQRLAHLAVEGIEEDPGEEDFEQELNIDEKIVGEDIVSLGTEQFIPVHYQSPYRKST